jgi:hypothetical protein
MPEITRILSLSNYKLETANQYYNEFSLTINQIVQRQAEKMNLLGIVRFVKIDS